MLIANEIISTTQNLQKISELSLAHQKFLVCSFTVTFVVYKFTDGSELELWITEDENGILQLVQSNCLYNSNIDESEPPEFGDEEFVSDFI